jgi:hypothetical protein
MVKAVEAIRDQHLQKCDDFPPSLSVDAGAGAYLM